MACVASVCVCAAFFAHEFRRRGPEELGAVVIEKQVDGDERAVVISGASFDRGGSGGFDEGGEKGVVAASSDQPTNPLLE